MRVRANKGGLRCGSGQTRGVLGAGPDKQEGSLARHIHLLGPYTTGHKSPATIQNLNELNLGLFWKSRLNRDTTSNCFC